MMLQFIAFIPNDISNIRAIYHCQCWMQTHSFHPVMRATLFSFNLWRKPHHNIVLTFNCDKNKIHRYTRSQYQTL